MEGHASPQGAAGGEPSRPNRFQEPLKFMPVVFVSCTMLGLYVIYVFYNCVPLLQLGESMPHVDVGMRVRGQVELVAFHILTILLVICYARCILMDPGYIPDGDPAWEYQHQNVPSFLQETKKTGDRRHCKWCGKYKPDRCHHCRVCKACILKMDHHCPWIYNCVGYFNYKFFFLLLFYSLLDVHLIFWTMPEAVKRSIEVETPFFRMFVVFFGETLAFFLGVLLTLFFGFHVWLMLKAMTTIEFCEKSLPKKDNGGSKSYDSSPYNVGAYGNIKAVLGNNPLLWLLPVSTPSSDGLNYVSDETRLTKDVEVGKGLLHKTNRKARQKLGGWSIGGYG